MTRSCCLGLMLLLVAPCAWGQAPAPPVATPRPARIAVVGAEETADLVGLLTSELSNNPAIALVERSDLAKVGDEAKVQQLAGTDAVALGKLIGADGLIFISKSPDGLQVRFTATGLGYALFDEGFDERFEATADLPHLAEVIAQRVTDYTPKLKLRPEAAIPLSILNLRADAATSDSSDFERKLTLLLESRLASVPTYVILERRHSSAIQFERVLTGTTQAPMQGVSVIDGTFTLPTEGTDDITVHLRLRPSGGEPVPLEVHGSIKDLPALANAMTATIGAKMNVAVDVVAWQPQAEAREYLLEGIWGLQHNAETAALEALDSAELLGANIADVTYARVPVLCGIAVGTASIMTGDHETPDDPHPEARVEAILRAFSEEARYENENMASKLQDVQPDNSTIGSIQMRRQGLARAAGSLLTMLDKMQHPRADEVRSAFRDYVGFDPAHGKYPQDPFLSIRYADSLSQTKEEEKDYYRYLLALPADSVAWRQVEGSLYRDTYCARFYPDDANGHDYERYSAYLNFLKTLYDGPARLTAMQNYAEGIIGQQLQADASKAFYQALTDQRDNLVATNQLAPYLSAAFGLEKLRGASEADPQVIALLHFLLQHIDHLDGHISQAWVPELFPTAEAPTLWKEFQTLEAKSPDSIFITNMRQSYLARFGNDEVIPGSLEVNRFWYPPNAPGKPLFARNPVLAALDGIWVAAGYVRHDSGQPAATAVLYHVTLDVPRPDPFPTDIFQIPDFDPEAMAITSSALYVIGSHWNDWKKTFLQRFDLSSQHFETHEVPTSRNIFEAGGKIYLDLSGPSIAEMEGGIALVDADTCETTLLASSRRNPAQNQFDNRSAYSAKTIFTGSQGKPWASIGFGEVYGIEDKPGLWSRVIPSGELLFSQTIGSRTILYGRQLNPGNANGSDIVFMIDSTKPNPELWLGAPGPLWGTEMVGKPEPLPPQPAWSQHPLWQQPQEDGPYRSEYGFRGDDLFSFVIHTKTQERELLWYRHGQTAPIRIPLSFKLSDDAANALKTMEDIDDDPIKKLRPPNNSPMSMFCAPQGLCFLAPEKGFWFLPFSDIDAYLKTAHN